MKKLIISILVLHLMLPYVFCGSNVQKNKKELKNIIKEVSKECPIQVDQYTSIVNMEYSHNTIVITYGVGLMNWDAFRSNEAALRSNILLGFANQQNEFFKKFIEAVIRANVDMRLIFIDGKGRNFSVYFTVEELKANMPGVDADPEMLLKSVYDNVKMQIPMEVVKGLTIKDVQLDKKSFVYIYECDESIIDIDNLNNNLSEIKKGIIENIVVNGVTLQSLTSGIKATNRNLVYKYVGSSSGKTVIVSIESDELP